MKNEKAEIISRLKKYGKVQALLQYVNIKTLKGVYYVVMKNGVGGAVGVEYGKNLDENLNRLLIRMRNFSYFPQPQDWLQRADTEGRYKKYMFRDFEDEIVQRVFEEILDAIFDFEIEKILPRITWPRAGGKSKRHILIAKEWLTIRTESIQEIMDTECLLSFLKQYIDDRKFIEYVRRFISREGQTNLESELSKAHTSMPNSVYIYYILKNVIAIDDCHLIGKMWLKKGAEGLRLMFTSPKDVRTVYLRMIRWLKKTEFDAETPICTLSVFSDRIKNHKVLKKHPYIVVKRTWQTDTL